MAVFNLKVRCVSISIGQGVAGTPDLGNITLKWHKTAAIKVLRAPWRCANHHIGGDGVAFLVKSFLHSISNRNTTKAGDKLPLLSTNKRLSGGRRISSSLGTSVMGAAATATMTATTTSGIIMGASSLDTARGPRGVNRSSSRVLVMLGPFLTLAGRRTVTAESHGC